MDQKEHLSCNPDPLVEFSDTMAQWYCCFQTAKTEQRPQRKQPSDSSPYWIVHAMACPGPVLMTGRLKRAGITLPELKKFDGKHILMVTDASGLPLGFDVLDYERFSWLFNTDGAGRLNTEAARTAETIATLLQRCMDVPMDGGMPRKPKSLRVNDEILHRLVHRHMLKQGKVLDMELWPRSLKSWKPLDQKGLPAFSLRWPPTRYCSVCKRRSFPSRLQECSRCTTVFYCEDKCFGEDAEHERWCARLASYMQHEAQLADLPFSYTAEVTSEDFSLEDFLFKNKLLSSYWVHWSLLVRSAQPHSVTRDAWLKGHSNVYEPLKLEAEVLMVDLGPFNVPSVRNPLVSWHQYYEWRGLSLSSVVAPLLSSSLSIYYIITSLVPKHFPEVNILRKQSLRIHIIESYRELHTLLTFWELSVLLPHVTFELVFICEQLPSWFNKIELLIHKTNGSVGVSDSSLVPQQKADERSIRVKVYCGTYHVLQEPKPDLVIGFKPLFLCKDSWFSTLVKLQSLRVPAFFCEFSELRCESSQQVMNKATGGDVSPPTINPFHCPLRINGGDNRLPRYSNSFIFHLVYKPLANVQQPVPVYDPSARSALRSLSYPNPTIRERKAAAQRRRTRQGKMKKKKMSGRH
ncbi:zinc finger MYND domain-containing protein 15 [Larimichthys crocea]|uniref:zinc finger MYND domain-containing protein 15 n=1 Tax=Larimichthys crocea TaxID=215358 RepID=UPI000F5EE5EE|nr:zinc finger MYND domain-containing protein 15 [Larimichthys crocea]